METPKTPKPTPEERRKAFRLVEKPNPNPDQVQPKPSPEHAEAIRWARDTIAGLSTLDDIDAFYEKHDARRGLPKPQPESPENLQNSLSFARANAGLYDLDRAIQYQQTQDETSPAYDPIAARAMAERILALSEGYDVSDLDAGEGEA